MTSIAPINGFVTMSKLSQIKLNENKSVYNNCERNPEIIKKSESKKLKPVCRTNSNSKNTHQHHHNKFNYIDEEDSSFFKNHIPDSCLTTDYQIPTRCNVGTIKTSLISNNSVNLSSNKTSDITTTVSQSKDISNHQRTLTSNTSINDSNLILKQITKDDGMSSRTIDTSDNKRQRQQQQQQQQQQEEKNQRQQNDQRCMKGVFDGAVDIAKDHLSCIIRNPIKNQLSQIHCGKSCVDDHDTSYCQPNKAAKINDNVASSFITSETTTEGDISDHFNECGPNSTRRIKRCSQSNCTKQYPHDHHHHRLTSNGINKCQKENDLEKNLQSSSNKDDQEYIREGARNINTSISESPLQQPTHSIILKASKISDGGVTTTSSESSKTNKVLDGVEIETKITDTKTENIEKSICLEENQVLLDLASTEGVKSNFVDNNNLTLSTKNMCGTGNTPETQTTTTTIAPATVTATATDESNLKRSVNCDTPISGNIKCSSDKKCDSTVNSVNNNNNSSNETNPNSDSTSAIICKKHMPGASTSTLNPVADMKVTNISATSIPLPSSYCRDDPIGISSLPSIDDNIEGDDDPYYELQEYLERVKREINEVFEQYKLRNDESPTCTNVDSNIDNNNKLSVHKTPCFINDTNSEKKLTEISNNKESERSANLTTIPMTMAITTTINVSSSSSSSSIAPSVAVVVSTPKIMPAIVATTSIMTTSSITPTMATLTRSSKLTKYNYNKKHASELQPENNQLQSQQQHSQNEIVIEDVRGSNAIEVTDDVDASTSASERKMELDINEKDTTDVKMWANTILKELDNLMGSDKRSSARSEKDRNVSMNNNENHNWTHSNILKPEKHTTIPLQSFSLERPLKEYLSQCDTRKDTMENAKRSLIFLTNNVDTTNITISCKDQTCDNQRQYKDNVTILKIEEDTTGGKPENEKSQSSQQTLATDTVQTKKEILQQASFLQNDGIKKGSTSTIWTSEESILRSVGAVDEDNKSTSSSACDEASALLSSVKSDNSSVSSEIDNENNESGIGTATPPKDVESCRSMPFKNTILHDNGTNINFQNLLLIDKMKFQKSNSVISSDDPDLLEVLSQFEGGNEDDESSSNTNYDFDLISDGAENDVVLRNKDSIGIERNFKMIVSAPIERIKKGRSHSIETTQFSPIGFELFHDVFDKDAKQKHLFCLPINQEPFQNSVSCNIRELPSPSSASLHSGNGALVMQELTMKSNSAPILLKKEKHKDGFGGHQNSLRYSRSQSDRYLAEIEAIEACKWLRAAGFPQYAQMYEDLQFPIDLSNVAKDHPMLENDPLQSLYRRLCVLNRCATMRLDNTHKQHGQQKDESDDEGFTLSENWTFQPQSRRWSRVGETGLEIPTKRTQQDKADASSKDSSPERFDDDSIHDESEDQHFSSFVLRSETPQPDNVDQTTVRLRRTGSERLKDSAKALLRRVESIKSRRRKRQNREGLVISGPQMLNLPHINQRMSEMKCIDVMAFSNPPSPSPTSPVNLFPRPPLFGNDLKVPTEHDKIFNPNLLSPKRTIGSPRSAHSTRTSPLHFFTSTMPHLREGKSDDSSSYYSDSQESTGGGKSVTPMKKLPRSRRFLQRSGKVDDIGTHSDSECHSGRKMILKDVNANGSEIKVKKLTRGGSLNFGKESKRYRDAFQSRSFRSRTTIRKTQRTSESDKEDGRVRRHVVRWHSFRSEESPQLLFKKCFTPKTSETQIDGGTPFSKMSCGQLQIIRKLALVTLTGYMERYCPTHRSGWNWELPKFIKKIKTPDYKDKKVFGVPLLLVLQRTGHALPAPIRGALKWLHINALDQIGLFRKSGVKSRISKLKDRIESSDTDCMDIYDSQQAYDVADLLKQYFRDLPDCLLTAKMSETFVAIFHHLPCDVRADAIQSAVLLLPDEHREVLYSLLKFLNEVADNSQYNQMTANNLAVCLAPSLFHSSISSGSRSTSASPRRRKITGIPDAKELTETKASHECLTFMISNFKQIFTASRDKILRCNFGYMEESKPVPLEALGEGMPFHNWRGYLYECTSATIKEGRERSRGWISVTSLDPNVEIAYKKVGDGHPLRLWRCSTEIEAPPNEVLQYILKERNSWDPDLLKCRTVHKLDERSEIFQYACDGQIITDYCVLRSWQPDLPRKACVIVETSIHHPDASLLLGGVRGVVLASRYLIEPCGSGKSRLMHLSRVDTKGRTPEWYNKCYGHICSHYLTNIRAAFRQITDGPESKV